MEISYSELPLLGNPVLENVDRLIAIGAKKIELMMDGEPWDNVDGKWSKLAKELVTRNVKFSVHPPAYDTNLTSESGLIREAVYDLFKHAIEFAASVGAQHIVLHPGFLGSPAFSKDTAIKRAMEATQKLSAFAAFYKVNLAFENVGYNGQSIYDMEEYLSVLDYFDENVGYLIDIGHAHLNGWDIPALIRRAAPRLLGFHFHDNDGKSDAHLPIFEGSVDWDALFTAIRETCPDCNIIFEYAPFVSIEQYPKDEKKLLTIL